VANKPIVTIGVDSSEFDRFTKAFEDYQAKLEEMPAAWERVNTAMGEGSEAGKALASGALTAREAIALAGAQAAIVAEALRDAVKAQEELGDKSHATNKKMGELGKTVKGLAGDIAGVGRWVLRLGAGALTGLGIGGILGGLGIGELANAAYNRSRTATGYGLTPGQLASFNVNAQPFLTPAALQGAASAQLSYQSAPYLQMLGIDFRRAQSMNAADLAFEMLRGAAKNWNDAQRQGLPPGSSPLVKAYEALGGNLEDVRRAANAGPGALSAAQGAYRRDIGSLGFDASTAAAWTRFKIQLDRAGLQIESVFIRRLAPLVPEFTQLSKDVINAIAGFVESKDFGKLISAMKEGLQNFVHWIEGPEPRRLWAGLTLIAGEIMAVAEKLKWLDPGHQASAIPPEPGHREPGYGKMGPMTFDAAKGLWVDNSTGSVYDPMSGVWQDKRGYQYDPKTKTWQSTGFKRIGELAWKAANFLTWGGLGELIPGAAGTSANNPLNMETTGGLFKHYATLADGIRAGAALLENYPKNWGTKTLAEAIPLWSGTTKDPVNREAYLSHLEQWSGVSRRTNIADLTREQLARVVAAMARQEGEGNNVTPEMVMQALYGKTPQAAVRKPRTNPHYKAPIRVSVTNSTSARVAVSANAVAVG
jgi:hypothetical protein